MAGCGLLMRHLGVSQTATLRSIDLEMWCDQVRMEFGVDLSLRRTTRCSQHYGSGSTALRGPASLLLRSATGGWWMRVEPGTESSAVGIARHPVRRPVVERSDSKPWFGQWISFTRLNRPGGGAGVCVSRSVSGRALGISTLFLPRWPAVLVGSSGGNVGVSTARRSSRAAAGPGPRAARSPDRAAT